MATEINTSIEEGVLIVSLVGTVRFGGADYRMGRQLISAVEDYVNDGGSRLLLDLSEVEIPEFSTSWIFVFRPFIDESIRGQSRVALNLGGNENLYCVLRAVNLVSTIDCFKDRNDAIGFLLSDEPMVDPAEHRTQFWSTLGREIGPERCKRADCDRLRIAQSVLCKKHHYLSVTGSEYKGETDA